MALHAAASSGSCFRSPDLLAIVKDITIVYKHNHYPLTIVAVIIKIQLLYCSWFQPEMSRQLCEDILKKEVTMQTLIMLCAAVKCTEISPRCCFCVRAS